MSILFHALLARGICDVPDSPERGFTACPSLPGAGGGAGLRVQHSPASHSLCETHCRAWRASCPAERLGFGLETRACGVSIGAVGSPAVSVGCAAGLSRAEQASSWLEAASSRGSVRLEGGEVWVRWVSPMDFSGCPSCWCCLLPPLWSPAVLLAPSPWEVAEHLQGGSVGSSELRLRKLCLKLSFLLACLP